MQEQQRVIAVVVTWNRRALLAEALQALQEQTVPVTRIIVVDNASDDGTGSMLSAQFPDVEVVRSQVNTGGAGGFAIGIDRALTHESDALWLMDDDTVARPGALDALVQARVGYAPGTPSLAPPALVASRVVWTDGREHPMNTPRAKAAASREERASAQRAGCTPIRTASFVSVLLDTARVREVGLPIADFFLWNDDFEYSARLVRGRRGIYCPASVVVHKTASFGGADADPGERFFFEVRNKVWTFTRAHGLNPAEKVLYGGSTARRWAGTIARSDNRPVLVRGLAKGLGAGLRNGPRDSATLIADSVEQHG